MHVYFLCIYGNIRNKPGSTKLSQVSQKVVCVCVYIYIYVCFVCWLELDSSIALCHVEQFLNPMCYYYQYFGPQFIVG